MGPCLPVLLLHSFEQGEGVQGIGHPPCVSVFASGPQFLHGERRVLAQAGQIPQGHPLDPARAGEAERFLEELLAPDGIAEDTGQPGPQGQGTGPLTVVIQALLQGQGLIRLSGQNEDGPRAQALDPLSFVLKQGENAPPPQRG